MTADYNLGAIRELLETAFNDEELRTLAFDNFTPVYDQFTAGQTQGARALLLADYARRQGRLAELLDCIRAANPVAYAAAQEGLLRKTPPGGPGGPWRDEGRSGPGPGGPADPYDRPAGYDPNAAYATPGSHTSTDPYEAPSAPSGVFTRRARPAMGGDSIGHDAGGAATFGCLLLGRAEPRSLYILCDFSGITPSGRQPRGGDAILQPGRADGGSRTGDVIATLTRWTRVRDDPAAAGANVSAAIAQVRRRVDVSAELRGLGFVRGIGEAADGAAVVCAGRTSGIVHGTILRSDANADLACPYHQITGGTRGTGGPGGLFEIPFSGLIETTPMLQPGDSGALLLDGQNNAVGLGFASSAEVSLFLPIRRVLDALEADLVTGEVWRALLAT